MADFNAEEFLDIGIKIANTYPNECGYRTAIGRVYYACHLIGSDATEQKGWFDPHHDGSDHRRLCGILNKRHVGGDVGDKLRELLELREHADYHIKKSSTGNCERCEKVADKKTWETAKSIACNILPRLKAIYPTRQK